jgi:hypothetical protein
MATAIGSYVTTALLKARLFDAGVTDTADDTLMGTICDQVNDFIESPAGTGRVIAPISSATYLLDIPEPRTTFLYVPKGIRAITDLSFVDFSGDTRDTIATTDYWLRPLVQDRPPGWPAMYIQMSDQPAGVHRYFPHGFEVVSLTCTAGWAAIPDVIIDVAVTTATRAWHARQNGQADLIGNDETGEPIVSRFVAPHHRSILKAYRIKQPAVIG